MNILDFFKTELKGWGKYERVLFPLGILVIILLSVLINDSKIALLSAICGISYTIIAGKGKLSCYFFGIISTLCYSYISFKNNLFGNFALNLLYYLPMQFIGIYNWKKHLNKKTNEIVKTNLGLKPFLSYLVWALGLSVVVALCLKISGDSSPFADSIATVFSILGLYLTVKRCIEQWCVWTIVNGFSMLMWIKAYLEGSHCFTTILMWFVYFILGIYFWQAWYKESASFEKNADN